MSQAHSSNDAHGGHHDPYLAHHFDTPEQQYSTGKLGMWMFLATEILMFGGLFCGYSVWRHNDPTSFQFGHLLLDTKMGAINTIILISSSFTMAWGVRAAQLGKTKALVFLMLLTLLGGGGFMVVKYFEYTAKFSHGTGPGIFFDEEKVRHSFGGAHDAEHPDPAHPQTTHVEPAPAQESVGQAQVATAAHAAPVPPPPASSPADPAQPASTQTPQPPLKLAHDVETALAKPGVADSHLVLDEQESAVVEHEAGHGELTAEQVIRSRVFIDIYFAMTGLHGIHVLVGMGLIFWIMVRAMRGTFGPRYFIPVDLVGLYWHLVDLIWIFLFPLLYLIET